MKEVLEKLINKKVRFTCVFGNSEPIFYNGIIVDINDSSVSIIDKFNNLVVLSLDSIKKVEVIKNEG